jgi:hypothetical protein
VVRHSVELPAAETLESGVLASKPPAASFAKVETGMPTIALTKIAETNFVARFAMRTSGYATRRNAPHALNVGDN